MAEYTANAVQLVQIGNNILLTETAVPGNASIIHREGSGLVTLRGLTSCQNRARFRATFSGNISIPTGQTPTAISVALALNGEPVGPTTMIVTPGVVDRFFNVSSSIYIDVPAGCCTQLSIENTSTIPINVQNANLIVERVA